MDIFSLLNNDISGLSEEERRILGSEATPTWFFK